LFISLRRTYLAFIWLNGLSLVSFFCLSFVVINVMVMLMVTWF